ncbi:MAG: sigma-54-dependent Fis family transcriptional regulator [Candidatus Zixiibacteriota bacterium]|nr:MAG: sigma-54-dependent Fis family transcriptional regulator [candidate division Zixibacteria bacterium]
MKKDKTKILIIDDDPKIAWILAEGLSSTYEIVSARDGIEGIQMVSTEKPDLILLDIKMPGMSGLEVLEKLGKLADRPDVIMLSGHGETKNIVESIHLGAAEFINKPFDVKELEIHVETILEKGKLKEEVRNLKSELKSRSQYEEFTGDSPKMVQVKNIIEQVADSELTVLIRGESGTGKEIVARMIHALSGRSSGALTKVNCAAIPRDLLEAELFGYEKGAFTGAHKTKPGRFEVANKGSIFLDEIGDMPLELQSKLLQVLEQQEFVRVGGINNIHVDVRIICATNKNLEEEIGRHNFRDDLFYRLNEITIFLPPLRDRREDIPLLVDHFLHRYNSLYQKEYPEISSETISKLLHFSWPGNVRQLENLIKQIVVRGDESIVDDVVSVAVAPVAMANSSYEEAAILETNPELANSYSLKKRVGTAVANQEKRLIREVLNKVNWNRRKAAELLEISYRSLLYKIKEYDLNSAK